MGPTTAGTARHLAAFLFVLLLSATVAGWHWRQYSPVPRSPELLDRAQIARHAAAGGRTAVSAGGRAIGP
jgi:hypothetical protein